MFADNHPGQVGLRLGYDGTLAHGIEAGADMFLVPSVYESCGLNQLYSLRYGTPPIRISRRTDYPACRRNSCATRSAAHEPADSGVRDSVPVMSRMPPPKVRYDQNQLTMVEMRLRTPTKKPTCTMPHSHHAGAPQSFMNPKSATAALRPIVARLPRWR